MTNPSSARGLAYKWIALSNTTLGVLMAAMNGTIVMISLPVIFRGLHVNPLGAGQTDLLLWVLMGYNAATTVLLVTFGRISDTYGKVRFYNLGFIIFTLGSILSALTPGTGVAGEVELIVFRIVQGIGGAFLFTNSAAIITDAFPANQRGLALGVNQIAAIGGSVVGLVLGGIVATYDWRWVFLVSVPVGLVGTVWAYLRLKEIGVRTPRRLDGWGNLTFGLGLTSLMVGLTYVLMPYKNSPMGWGNPWIQATIVAGVVLLIAFVIIEQHVPDPMFELRLFRIRPFWAGNLSGFLGSLGRGGLQFMLIIWLQGIWLPEHGYSFSSTPLWAGISMLPLSVGFLISGPFAGHLADRFGARPLATGGMVLAAIGFLLLIALPVDFPYWAFGLLIFLNGLAMGLFAAPNQTGIMNSLPPDQRGAGAGMAGTFMNSASVLSIGIFFSLIIIGLAATLPSALYHGLASHGVPHAYAVKVSHLPPVGSLFAAFLGYNPMRTTLAPILRQLPHSTTAYLTGHKFFPTLVSHPFATGIHEAFVFAAGCCLLAAIASGLRGGKYFYAEPAQEPERASELAKVA